MVWISRSTANTLQTIAELSAVKSRLPGSNPSGAADWEGGSSVIKRTPDRMGNNQLRWWVFCFLFFFGDI